MPTIKEKLGGLLTITQQTNDERFGELEKWGKRENQAVNVMATSVKDSDVRSAIIEQEEAGNRLLQLRTHDLEKTVALNVLGHSVTIYRGWAPIR